MPSRSHACIRARPAVSPGGTDRCRPELAAGARPTRSSAGTGACAARRAPRGAAARFQARQNGVKTAYGLGLPMSATKLPGCAAARRPLRAARPRRARSRRHRERRHVGGEVDARRRRARAPARQLGSGLPCADDEFPPRSRSAARSSLQALEHERVRGSEGRRPRSSASSSTKTGTTRSSRRARRAAAGDRARAGRAGTRRARSTIAVGYGTRAWRLGIARVAGPGLPAVPARSGRAAERAGTAAHLRGALQDDDRAMPRGGVGVRDRLARRRRPAPDRLRMRDRRGARADARRPAQHVARGTRPFRIEAARTSCPTRPAPSSSSTTATRRSTPRPPAPAHAAYADLVEQADRPHARPGRDRRR